MRKGNIYGKIPKKLPKELFNTIIYGNKIKIERIVSKKHKSPKGYWYDQNENEFVMILKGNAELTFIVNKKFKKLKMRKGNYVNIPSHLKHRVDKTSKETVWLAIFY